MCGKYEIKTSELENHITTSIEECLVWIANELAEQNRLERFELWARMFPEDYKDTKKEDILRDLEDRA